MEGALGIPGRISPEGSETKGLGIWKFEETNLGVPAPTWWLSSSKWINSPLLLPGWKPKMLAARLASELLERKRELYWDKEANQYQGTNRN